MGSKWGDEYSVIGDEAEVPYIDYEHENSVCNSNMFNEEGPVVISKPFPFMGSKPQSVTVGETAADSITITNTTEEPVDLWTQIYASNPEDSFTLSIMKPPTGDSNVNNIRGFLESFKLEDRMVQPGETMTLWISCKPKSIGLHTSIVHLDVGNDRIERVVFLLAEDKISQSLASQKPFSFSKTRKNKSYDVNNFVVGSRPARADYSYKKYRLPRYDIPKDIRALLERKEIPDFMHDGLTKNTYAAYFKVLLVMEEIQMEEDMRGHNMESAVMRKKGQFLTLEVLGLAEKRPSLVHGDCIFAKLVSDDSNQVYQGCIHRVEAEDVYLKFNPDFHARHRPDNLYSVQFTYNRVNMRRLYQASDAAEELETEVLFPSEFTERRQIKAVPAVPISCTLNEEQLYSISMILGCKGAPPYLIYGPPGTGKTMTLVEAILQLYKNRAGARLLVCAPSNSAADHLLEKILAEKNVELREGDIFRLNAPSRSYEDVNPEHIRFSFFDNQVFQCPPLGALNCYKIIISTYMSASLLRLEGVKRGHFSHIFLDEAGQASEPESMVPISNFCQKDTTVVIAGDPKQLGPIVYSKEAEAYGLGTSYLERLYEYDLYKSEDESYLTKLVRNYRCHHSILDLPSKLFYEGGLLACREVTSSFMGSVNFLPNKEFPVVFYGIQGCDEREGNNPSWFNRFEASKVVEVIKKLTVSGDISEEDIGVITPYRQQVLKLKKAFENLDMVGIKVGSVEQFQGQEKEVIITSTVRSTIKHKEFDKTHCLGFLSNPRRFNVAITRAISLMIIIGNPHIITKDQYWNQLLWYCVDNGSYEGCKLPEREEQTVSNFEDDSLQNFVERKDDSWKNSGVENWVDDSWKNSCGGENWEDDSWKNSGSGGNWEDDSWKNSGGGGNLEDDSWNNTGGGGNLEDDSWKNSGGGGNLEDDSWKNSGGGGNLEDDSWKNSGGEGNLEDDSWKNSGGGGNLEDGSWKNSGGGKHLEDGSWKNSGGGKNWEDDSSKKPQGGNRENDSWKSSGGGNREGDSWRNSSVRNRRDDSWRDTQGRNREYDRLRSSRGRNGQDNCFRNSRGGKWEDDSQKTSEWGQEPYEIPKPVTDEAEWGDGWK